MEGEGAGSPAGPQAGGPARPCSPRSPGRCTARWLTRCPFVHPGPCALILSSFFLFRSFYLVLLASPVFWKFHITLCAVCPQAAEARGGAPIMGGGCRAAGLGALLLRLPKPLPASCFFGRGDTCSARAPRELSCPSVAPQQPAEPLKGDHLVPTASSSASSFFTGAALAPDRHIHVTRPPAPAPRPQSS